MTTLVLGPDGEQTCEECAHSMCAAGHICEAEECRCDCRRGSDRDYEQAVAERVAAEIRAESYDLAGLIAERYGRRPRLRRRAA